MVARSETMTVQGQPLDTGIWVDSVCYDRKAEERTVIVSAVELAEQAHRDQRRRSGEPYLSHCLAVAEIVHHLNLDHEAIAAAILHDVVEDCAVTLEQLEVRFGVPIARMVAGVTKMGRISELRDSAASDHRNTTDQAENIRKLLLAMAEDVRVVIIKLADRLHNMRTLRYLDESQQRRIARETLDIYAPLANRLGIWHVKWELEDLALRYLEPDTYRQIAALLDGRRVDRERHIEYIKAELRRVFQEAGINAEITGRPKHIYSIWRKMQRKNVDFHQIFDVQAVRVLVDKTRDCYSALGLVHALWRHIPHEFDDYIANPKANNYRSLHTAVVGPEGKPIEVQIRTHDMHEHAELGIAAHWRYKEGRAHDAAFEKKVAWLRQLLEWRDEEQSAVDFVDRFKSESVEERLYVLTPHGQVIDLPVGATALDFAYHIHTDVGHRCRGVRVNGRMVPLNYELRNGEQVEVLTGKHSAPSRDWINPHLGYLKTSRARSKVRHWFKQQDRDISITAGRDALERELHRFGLGSARLGDVLGRLNFKDVDTLLAAIGRGEQNVAPVVSAVLDISHTGAETGLSIPLVGRRSSRPADADAFKILGVGNLLTQPARCCRPVPNDPIVGYITRGRGVTIHRSDCPNVLRLKLSDAERLIDVQWCASDQLFTVDIQVLAYDRRGLLHDISSVLANDKINVMAVNTRTDKTDMMARMELTLEVEDIEQLSRILDRIGQLPSVTEVRRKT